MTRTRSALGAGRVRDEEMRDDSPGLVLDECDEADLLWDEAEMNTIHQTLRTCSWDMRRQGRTLAVDENKAFLWPGLAWRWEEWKRGDANGH